VCLLFSGSKRISLLKEEIRLAKPWLVENVLFVSMVAHSDLESVLSCGAGGRYCAACAFFSVA